MPGGAHARRVSAHTPGVARQRGLPRVEYGLGMGDPVRAEVHVTGTKAGLDQDQPLGVRFDEQAVEAAMAGADHVVHLGGLPDEAPLADLLDVNVLGTHHVLKAARRTGVKRVVLASSNRVAGFYPVGHRTSPQEPVRPDGLYGVSKAAIEALGRLYADKFGLSVICLRIGNVELRPTEPRHLATWLSPRDAFGYVEAALTAPQCVRFATVYAVSANTRRFRELPDPQVLDYTPVDDAESHAEDIVGADDPADPTAPQAGPCATPQFTLDHLPSA